ncbi:hypothetical protein H2509_02430 [Stappia sp. F7233]|uniref:Alpha/beta hydrolase n=1 Tax=Stappia albiluteola TaxID=2758565 RepID=A0A839A8S1_9HYPH|nr:hypothetical protein [Stappia albiluteola]MBA5775980.1 hypothetical protein [Stappia albiluteola]
MQPGGMRRSDLILERWGFLTETPGVPLRKVQVGKRRLPGILALPDDPPGLVVFALGAGSSRLSPHNRCLQRALAAYGFAVLLFDLLEEEEANDLAAVFDVAKLAGRIVEAIEWIGGQRDLERLPLGVFSARTGTAAALLVSALLPEAIGAHVARRGRPDLVRAILPQVKAPTLFLLGTKDSVTKRRYEKSVTIMNCVNTVREIDYLNSLSEDGKFVSCLVEVADRWFSRYLCAKLLG